MCSERSERLSSPTNSTPHGGAVLNPSEQVIQGGRNCLHPVPTAFEEEHEVLTEIADDLRRQEVIRDGQGRIISFIADV